MTDGWVDRRTPAAEAVFDPERDEDAGEQWRAVAALHGTRPAAPRRPAARVVPDPVAPPTVSAVVPAPRGPEVLAADAGRDRSLGGPAGPSPPAAPRRAAPVPADHPATSDT